MRVYPTAKDIYEFFVKTKLNEKFPKIKKSHDLCIKDKQSQEELELQIQLDSSIKRLGAALQEHKVKEVVISNTDNIDKKYIDMAKIVLGIAGYITQKCKRNVDNAYDLANRYHYDIKILHKYINQHCVYAEQLGLNDGSVNFMLNLKQNRDNSKLIYDKWTKLLRNKNISNLDVKEFSLSELVDDDGQITLVFSQKEKLTLRRLCGQGINSSIIGSAYSAYSALSTEKMRHKFNAPMVGAALNSATLEMLIRRMLTDESAEPKILECYHAHLCKLSEMNKCERLAKEEKLSQTDKSVKDEKKTKKFKSYPKRTKGFTLIPKIFRLFKV
jgi:hypothetical protein